MFNDIDRYLKNKEIFFSFLSKFLNFLFHNFIYVLCYDLVIKQEEITKNYFILFLLYVSLWFLACVVYYLFLRININDNWINRFFKNIRKIDRKIIDAYGRPSFFGIKTKIEHPDLMSTHRYKEYLGWTIDKDFRFHLTKNDSKKYLAFNDSTSLWTGSDSVKIDLPLMCCSKKDALNVYCLVMNHNTVCYKDDVLISFPLKKEYLNGQFEEKLKTEILKNENCDIGILSMFEYTNARNQSEYGIFVLVSLKEKDSQFPNSLNGHREVSRRIIQTDNNDIEKCIEAYALLTYKLSRNDRIFFANAYNSEARKCKKKADEDQVSKKPLLENVGKPSWIKTALAALKFDFLRAIHKMFFGDFTSELYAIWTFALFKIVLPYAQTLKDEPFVFLKFLSDNKRKLCLLLVYLFVLVLTFVIVKIHKATMKNYFTIEKLNYFSLPNTILTNKIVLPESKNEKRLLRAIDYTDVKIHLIDESLGDYGLLNNYSDDEIKNEINDGKKYRLIDYSEDIDGYDLTVDLCHYTDCRKLHNLIDKKDQNTKSKKIISDYNEFYKPLDSFAEDASKSDINHLPPNNLCLHMIIITKDRKLLITKRRDELKYEKGKLDFSMEEQLSYKDFCNDGMIIDSWIRRALEEELGLTKYSARRNDFFDTEVTSLFLENKHMNFSLCAFIRLKIKADELQAVMDGWPRGDYEFDNYQIIDFSQLEHYICNFRKNYANNIQEEMEKWHSSAFNRLYQFSVYYKLTKMKEAIRELI